jgi:hypothetical protein
MLIPDFTRYSLALLQGDVVVYSSSQSGLWPLWEALDKFRGRSAFMLHDKVIGLAAARLVARSGVISDIFTRVASLPAKEFLEECGIRLTAAGYAENILTKDKSAVCPGEVIAMSTADPDAFLRKISAMLNQQVSLPSGDISTDPSAL